MVSSIAVLQLTAHKCDLLTTPLPTLGISCLSDNSLLTDVKSFHKGNNEQVMGFTYLLNFSEWLFLPGF